MIVKYFIPSTNEIVTLDGIVSVECADSDEMFFFLDSCSNVKGKCENYNLVSVQLSPVMFRKYLEVQNETKI